MRVSHLTVIAIGLAASLAPLVQAQQQPPQKSPSANASQFGVAVVDVSYVFKNYQQFKNGMEAMKRELEAAEANLKSERDSVEAKEAQRQQYAPGSAEFNQLDEDIARLKAEFNLKAGKVRREFLDREAKVYFTTYTEVSQAVARYADHHNIGIVLRFNGDPIDPSNREDILRAINMPVVYQNFVDITPDVLALLNRGNGNPAAPTAQNPAAGSPVRR